MNKRTLLFPLLGLGVAIGYVSLPSDTSTKTSESTSCDHAKGVASTVAPKDSFSAQLAQKEMQIEARKKRAMTSKSWLDWETVALLEAERARLTGDYESYVRAEAALDEAFALAPKGAGPFESRVFLNLRLHRLSRVEADLTAMESAAVTTKSDTNRIRGFRADVAYYSGDMARAKELYGVAVQESPGVRSIASLARLEWKSGNIAEAEALLASATKHAEKGSKADRAWLKLMQGLMKLDQNRLDEALAFYEAGLEIQPGYWLLEEHIAEVHLLKGDEQRALHMYEDLVVRTNSPEFMDQIASIWRDRGNQSEFERWRDRAREIHLAHFEIVPEAAAGHALDHFLELETDRAKALELALANHSTRPGGEAKEKLVSAYLLNGQTEQARDVAETMIASGWKTPDALALASLSQELGGDRELAKRQASEATALADDAMERVSWLRDAML